MGSETTVQGEPLVSIVIPTYNRAHMLPAAIDACLGQTYKNIEIIVVNDGSKDNTDEILQQFASKDSRVRAFNKPNEGIADTLNYGHERARGEYVTWTSDDNLYYPDAIAKMVDYLQKSSDVGMVYTDVRFIDANGEFIRYVEAPEPQEMGSRCCVQGCLLYRANVVSTVGKFQRRWLRCQDYDYYLRIQKHFKIGRLPEILYDYRWHAASMSGDAEAMVLENGELKASYASSYSERRAIRSQHLSYLGRYCENRWMHWKAAYYYLRSAFYTPSKTKDSLRNLIYAIYGSLPVSFKMFWREMKKMFLSAGPR